MSYAYYRAQTIRDASVLLAQNAQSLVIAGGTDLMLDLRAGKKSCQALVDITGIAECGDISLKDGCLRLGACCTFGRLEKDPLVRRYAAALAQASSQVGSPQIRSVATLGGNVVNALPAADAAVALVSLAAEAEIVGQNGVRRTAVAECYQGIGKSTVDAGREFISAFYIPIWESERFGSAYQRFALRESLALPVAAASVSVLLADGAVGDCRLVLAPAGSSPWRAAEAENFLRGNALTEASAAAAPFRDSPVRCSAKYKRMLAETLARDALLETAKGIAQREEERLWKSHSR